MTKKNDRQNDAEPRQRRSRRGLLAGAAGGLGVIATQAIVKATPAMADNGQPVLQGADNGHPTSRTAVFTTNNNEIGILADPNSSGHGSLGVYGVGQDVGVRGEGAGGGAFGVAGFGAGSFAGVLGNGGPGSGRGVEGLGGPPNGIGVVGDGNGQGNGVEGNGGSNDGFGVVGTGGGSRGVGVQAFGGSNAPGVVAFGGGSAAGVTGVGGNGVEGQATSAAGAGVLAENTAGGDALRVAGKATFSRSGILTVAAGASSAMKTGVSLSSASLVLATIQANLVGVYVHGVTLVTGASGSFTVHLNKAVPAGTKVAWFVVN